MKIFKLKYGLVMLLLSGWVFTNSCNEITVDLPVDPAVQKLQDIDLIEEYLLDRNITDVDTTASGVRYYVEEAGSGEPIIKDDIVKVNFIGKTLDGTIVYTNIPEVADTSVAVSPFSNLDPRVFTYSETGWSLSGISFRDGALLLQGRGLPEAIGKGFQKVNVDGHLVVLLPSDQAIGTTATSFIPSNSVLIYDIFPIEKL
jgi:hypothetical protein